MDRLAETGRPDFEEAISTLHTVHNIIEFPIRVLRGGGRLLRHVGLPVVGVTALAALGYGVGTGVGVIATEGVKSFVGPDSIDGLIKPIAYSTGGAGAALLVRESRRIAKELRAALWPEGTVWVWQSTEPEQPQNRK